LLVAVRQHNRLAATRLGDKLAKLSLGFPDGNRFHVGTLIFGTTSRKRLDVAEPATAVPADVMPAKKARETGHYRIEGRDYVVKDGDVLLFKFNV
jgi:hypothetical protein